MHVKEQHRRAREKITSGCSHPRDLETNHISSTQHCKTTEVIHGYRNC